MYANFNPWQPETPEPSFICDSVCEVTISDEPSQLDLLKDAVASGNKTRVHRLLKEKPKLNCQVGGEILWNAVVNNQLGIASMLVEAGVHLNPFDQSGSTLLHELVKSSNTMHHLLAVLMMERGADVDLRDGRLLTILDCAIRAKRSMDLIRQLLKYGACLKKTRMREIACHPEAVELVTAIVAGIVENEMRRQKIHEWLLYLIGVYVVDEDEILPLVKVLLDMNLAVAQTETDRVTLLRAISDRNRTKMLQLLLQYGFDVNVHVPGSELPLYAAAKLELSDIVEMLIQAGAEVNARLTEAEGVYEACAIHAACHRGLTRNIRILLRHGADINLTDSENETPFSLIEFVDEQMSAAHSMMIRHLAIIINKGKNINERDLDIIVSYSGMREYHARCLIEVDKMKSIKIVGNVSFLTVFKNFRELCFLTRNSYFLENYDKAQRKDEFPVYYEDMNFVIEEAKKSRDSMTEKEKAICESLNNFLPYIPLEKVIYYFYLNDIK